MTEGHGCGRRRRKTTEDVAQTEVLYARTPNKAMPGIVQMGMDWVSSSAASSLLTHIRQTIARDAVHQHHHRSTSPSCTPSRQTQCRCNYTLKRQLALVRGDTEREEEKQPNHCTDLDIHPGRESAPAVHAEPLSLCCRSRTLAHLAADPRRLGGIPSPPLAISTPSNTPQREWWTATSDAHDTPTQLDASVETLHGVASLQRHRQGENGGCGGWFRRRRRNCIDPG